MQKTKFLIVSLEDDHVNNYVAFNVYTDHEVFTGSVINGVIYSVVTTTMVETKVAEKREYDIDFGSDSFGE